ncbi:protein MKS1-like [Ipomoea triloba]|uniref:protein MKS1-like n=1 Tax=Ipomoea triloba TaxID=35885 RepID=UPI00125E3289|nr:protein MKS1-like [Ipomoea triloba]
MDYSPPENCAAGRSPRRELQGPRPTPLKVRKDSHKIRKPPAAPATQHPKPPPPPPVIIYTVSPKIIHANPSEFMALVQRLTGPESSASTSSSSVAAAPPQSAAFHQNFNSSDVGGVVDGGFSDRPGVFPAGLTANPASLQPTPIPSSNFFSPPSDQNLLGFFPDLSNKNNLETSLMMANPSPFFISPRIISPGTSSLDLLSNLFDLQHYS